MRQLVFLGIDFDKVFKSSQKRQPNKDFWDYVKKLTVEELKEQLKNKSLTIQDKTILKKIKRLRR